VSPLLSLEHHGDVALLKLRAPKANSLGKELLEALFAALDEIDHATALVITGAGNTFSAGLALPELIDFDRAQMSAHIELFERVMRRILTEPRATVAAINGHAFAGGCVIALQCDARVMAGGDAKIGLNEIQLGIGIPALVAEPLRHRVPASSLSAIALAGRLFHPEQARSLGLVDEVVAPDRLEARAIELAAEMGRAPLAYMQIKHAMLRPVLEAIDRVAHAEREAWLDTWFSAHAQKLLRAAVDKLTKR
jgi:enoyl-CoA hydratase